MKRGGQENLFRIIKEYISLFFNRREFVLITVFAMLFIALIGQCFNLQIVQGEYYLEETTMLIQKTREVVGTRGNIYDSDGALIAYNVLSYSVTIEDNGDYDTQAEKNEAINEVIAKLITIIESNGDSVISDYGIAVNDEGEYAFTSEEDTTTRLRFLADIFGYASSTSLSEEQLAMSADEIIEYFCTDATYGYGIDMENLSKEEVIKFVTIRYAISLNSYSKYIATTVAEDVSDKTMATVMERSNELQGVSIAEDTIRCYNNAYLYGTIVGYTGAISEDEYQSYIDAGYTDYSRTDIVGKTGLEQVYDTELQGTKGEEKLYTDNLGNLIDSVTVSEAEAGNDIYLTLDTDLMEVTYYAIEQELAGIIYSRLENVLNYDRSTEEDSSDIIIPIGDVYNAFFDNQLLDVDAFEDADAGTYEVQILELYNTQYEVETSALLTYIQNSNGDTFAELSDEQEDYVDFIVNDLLYSSSSVILKSEIDTTNEIYQEWVSGDLNLYDYFNFLISNNYIDTSILQDYMGTESAYSNSSEIFDALLTYIETKLATSSGYEKLIYEYMIRGSQLSGKLICLAALEQGFFKFDETEYNNLISGAVTAYDYMSKKIYNIEVTPGELGLEPCSASAVITDPNTGDVLALVSYPGYDTNLLANTMDSDYYSQLINSSASPFYNHATLEKTAPGSTFKMITAIAGLEEGVIDTSSLIYCSGTFEKVYPSANCWIYPYSHNYMSVTTALQNSCNGFFYELGYRLSLTNTSVIGTDDKYGSTTYDYYSSDLGTDTLSLYATMFGLGTTSGIEISEAQPEISDMGSVPSAIGQGTHNYTTSQLARYVTAIANEGTVYDLTLMDKLTTSDGTLIEEYETDIYNEITEISSSTWDAIHTGMELMVENNSVFTDLEEGITIAGKTGTAQQSSTSPDHALFVGFAPVDDPEIAICVRITNGYTSSYASEVSSQIIQYYLGALEKTDIITGIASDITTTTTSD